MKKLGLKQLNQLLTAADKIAIVTILIISLTLIILTPKIIAGQPTQDKEVVVTLRGREIFRHRLVNSQQEKRVRFDFTIDREQYHGVLRMKQGRVKLERLNKEISPLPIHNEMGWISKPYQVIVCMPIKLTVKIDAGDSGSQSEVDVHTF